MKEVWKDIPNYNGIYQCSNLGKIKRICRARASQIGRILKPIKQTSGHLSVDLSKNGINKRFGIHRLVLEAFVGPCPPGMECRHLDGNPKNNRVDNLKWGTRSENMQDSIKHGTFKHNPPDNSGSNCGTSKLTDEQVIEIKVLIKKGELTDTEIGKIYKVSRSTIRDIRLEYTWKYVN